MEGNTIHSSVVALANEYDISSATCTWSTQELAQGQTPEPRPSHLIFSFILVLPFWAFLSATALRTVIQECSISKF